MTELDFQRVVINYIRAWISLSKWSQTADTHSSMKTLADLYQRNRCERITTSIILLTLNKSSRWRWPPQEKWGSLLGVWFKTGNGRSWLFHYVPWVGERDTIDVEQHSDSIWLEESVTNKWSLRMIPVDDFIRECSCCSTDWQRFALISAHFPAERKFSNNNCSSNNDEAP